MIDMITFKNKEYPSKTVTVPTFGERCISVESLENVLLDADDGRYVNDEAKAIDEDIFFYVPDEVFNKYLDKQLTAYVDVSVSPVCDHEYEAEGEWINSDDMQRCRMIIPEVYELVEANEVDDKYAISSPMVIDLNNWKTDDGYTNTAISIIESYYGSVENFESSYSEQTDKDQILAEMLYEQTSILYGIYPDTYSEEIAVKILDHYCENGKMPNGEEIERLENHQL